MNNTMRPLILPLVLLMATACYTPPNGSSKIMQRIVDSRELYSEPGFTIEALEREGITPLAAYMSVGSETFRSPLSQGLVEVLETYIGDAMVHPNVAINRINESGLTQDYATMRATYEKTSILSNATLRSLSAAIEVRYVAVPVLINFDESLVTRFSMFGVRLAKTASANARFQLQIWDAQTGHIVWEGLSDLTLGQETLREERILFDDLVLATWENLITKIPSENQVEAPE